MRRRRFSGIAVAFTSIVLLGAQGVGVDRVAAAAERVPSPHARGARMRAVCARHPGLVVACNALMLATDGIGPLATPTPSPGALRPADLAAAYKYSLPVAGSKWVWNKRIVAIVDAMDNPNAAKDLATYRTTYHLPPCTVANGCFKKLNQDGGASPLPAPDANWGKEIDLDIEMVSAVCPMCKIRLIEASSTSVFDMVTAEDRAATIGAVAVSNSWGSVGEIGILGPLFLDSYFDHPGVAITAGTGDSGYAGSWPSDVPTVVSVGGTSLTRSSTARGWTESAWSGGGSWCSDFDAQASWQSRAVVDAAARSGTAVCTNRVAADVSAVADQKTGVSAYDSFGSSGGANWYVFGGTSVSTPLIASMYARAGDHVHDAANPYPARATYNAWYANPHVLNDAVTGSNGSCGTDPVYMCNGEVGYDAPTGLGTPNGLAAF